MKSTIIFILCIFLLFLIPSLVYSIDLTLGSQFGFASSGYYGNNINDQIMENLGDPDSGTGTMGPFSFSGGILFQIGFHKIFAIQPEVNITYYGFTYSYIYTGLDYEVKERFLAIDLPLYLKLRLSIFHLGVGPVFTLRLNDVNQKIYIDSIQVEESKAPDNYHEKYSIGISIKPSFYIPIKSFFLILGGKLNLGLTQFTSEQNIGFDSKLLYLDGFVGFGYKLK